MAIVNAVKWHNKWYRAEAVNKGDWFGKCWLLMIPAGMEAFMFIVEADHESDALDMFVDSKFAHLVLADNQEEIDENSSFAGNDGLVLDPYINETLTITRLHEGWWLYGISQKDMDKLNGD